MFVANARRFSNGANDASVNAALTFVAGQGAHELLVAACVAGSERRGARGGRLHAAASACASVCVAMEAPPPPFRRAPVLAAYEGAHVCLGRGGPEISGQKGA